jgi:hypothetical protein
VIGHVVGKIFTVSIQVLLVFLDAFVSVSLWCYIACWAVGLSIIVIGFWIQDWWLESGRAIGM